MTTHFVILPKNWTYTLAESIDLAEPGDVIEVHDEAMKELAENAAERMGKDGLIFEIVPPPDPFD